MTFFNFFFTPWKLISHLQACGEWQEVNAVTAGILAFAYLQEMRGENMFSWIRQKTFLQDSRCIQAFWSLFPIIHSFFAQAKIKLQHPTRRWESTGAWPRTANSNLGQAVPVCLTEGVGLSWFLQLIWEAIQLHTLQASKRKHTGLLHTLAANVG